MIDDHTHDRLVPATGASIAIQGRPGSFCGPSTMDRLSGPI
jgi:hypothetical protein